ncbi:MAG: Gfo/Idh/MocA family oxidoreductase, partial [Phycisphaeraceae bacterium]|nr:Gfo/Idh/MocA family oxidoreductase [Phycisphaeraceae bacterium]
MAERDAGVHGRGWTRREFVAGAGAAAAGLALGSGAAFGAAGARASVSRTYARNERLRVGLIGCGGRGTGAAVDALTASDGVEIYALGDVFPERIDSCRSGLEQLPTELRQRVAVDAKRVFTGFDAYKGVIGSGVDVVILATPPGFRPGHFAAAVEAGKHVFMEKPVAVDGPGVRTVLAAAERAAAQRLSVVAGTQRRHERCYLEAMERLRGGAIGSVRSARVYWNQGGLWVNARQPAWSDMEWQLRNWLYFAWLSGDHIVEQHVHNLDVANWAIGATPVRCTGMGGRQVRTDAAYGHIFDHFAVEYEYPGGVVVSSMCRQIDGCAGRVEEVVVGTQGVMVTASGRARIEGERPWRFEGEN